VIELAPIFKRGAAPFLGLALLKYSLITLLLFFVNFLEFYIDL
jgi:hypothetical protein